jgi:hypothetical protein
MKTVNLKKESPSVGELLAMARKKSVLLVSKDGATFVLEEADEFDREVAELGSSEKFMRFLRKRSKEKAVTSIEEFAEELTAKTHNKGLQPPAHSRRSAVPSARKKRSPRRG